MRVVHILIAQDSSRGVAGGQRFRAVLSADNSSRSNRGAKRGIFTDINGRRLSLLLSDHISKLFSLDADQRDSNAMSDSISARVQLLDKF